MNFKIPSEEITLFLHVWIWKASILFLKNVLTFCVSYLDIVSFAPHASIRLFSALMKFRVVINKVRFFQDHTLQITELFGEDKTHKKVR